MYQPCLNLTGDLHRASNVAAVHGCSKTIRRGIGKGNGFGVGSEAGDPKSGAKDFSVRNVLKDQKEIRIASDVGKEGRKKHSPISRVT